MTLFNLWSDTFSQLPISIDTSTELSHVYDLSSDAICVWSEVAGILRWNAGAETLFDLPERDVLGLDPHYLTGAVYPTPWEDIRETLADGNDWSGDTLRTRGDGGSVRTLTRIRRLCGAGASALYLQIDRPLTLDRFPEEADRMIAREVNHRVNNLFSVLRGLVRLSSRGTKDARVMEQRLSARIDAYAYAHRISFGNEKATGSLLDLLHAIVGLHERSLTLSGPEVTLPVATLSTLGLILHELAANALKHGGWASDDGRVEVLWSVGEASIPGLLQLAWIERMPPEATAGLVARQWGFGSMLIERSARQIGATVTRTIDGGVYRALICLPLAPPLPSLQAPGE